MKLRISIPGLLVSCAIALLLIAGFSAYADTLPTQPNDHLTPGAVDPEVTQAMIAGHTFNTAEIRNVPESVIEEVYARYGLKKNTGYCGLSPQHCEVDHRVSCENGGICGLKRDVQGKLINDPLRRAQLVSNLWPQIYEPGIPCGAHHKDKLENTLAALVRAGKLTLAQDQAVLMGDWIAGYVKYVDPKGCS